MPCNFRLRKKTRFFKKVKKLVFLAFSGTKNAFFDIFWHFLKIAIFCKKSSFFEIRKNPAWFKPLFFTFFCEKKVTLLTASFLSFLKKMQKKIFLHFLQKVVFMNYRVFRHFLKKTRFSKLLKKLFLKKFFFKNFFSKEGPFEQF